MNYHSHLALALAAFLVFGLSGKAADVTVTVENIPTDSGTLMIGFYNSEETFRDKQLPQSVKVDVTSKGSLSTVVTDLEPGEYAIAVVHDLNGNDKLDSRGGFKIPVEPFGFTNNPKIMFGPPKYSQCVFIVEESGTAVSVKLKTK